MNLTIVVNGQPVNKSFIDSCELAHVRHVVLHETGNVGQRPENWEFRNTLGEIIPADSAIYQLPPSVNGRMLFLNLKAGVGA